MAGGFVGRLETIDVVENCYSTGDVGQGGNANASGGFAGQSSFRIPVSSLAIVTLLTGQRLPQLVPRALFVTTLQEM